MNDPFKGTQLSGSVHNTSLAYGPGGEQSLRGLQGGREDSRSSFYPLLNEKQVLSVKNLVSRTWDFV